MHENDLKLVNRAFVIGDVVKKRTSDAISGFVARTSIECTLLPVYPGLELRNEAVWPPRKDRILRRIPGEELRHHEDFYEGDYVIYHGWVGVVNSVFEDVTIRLSDGSVVSVENSEEVLVPALKSGQRKQAIRAIDATRGFAWLVHTLSVLREQGKGDDPAACFYPGQRVVTKKTNLRRGNWKFGAYNANVAPKGIVVNVQESGIKVTWLASNVYNRDRDDLEPPPEYLADDELGSGEVRAYNNERLSSQTDVSVGTMKGSSLMSGDHVKFEDIAGAAVKYSEGSEHGSEHGILRRIPRTETRGYDMNVYLVRETNMKLLIHWQDGSKSEEEAKNVVPYLNSDEHEVWPGKIVAIEANESAFTQTDASMTSNEFLKPSRVGIVQSTNARERTAIVRWFAEPRVQILNSPDSVLIPGSTLGTLSDEHSEVSYFEIISYPALAKLRGDLVLIAPEQGPQVQENEVCERPSGRMIEYFSSTFNNLRNHFPSSITSSVNETLTPRPGRNSHDWFGTIVDLGLDGILTVRLGALDVIKDVKVPIERVTTLVEAGADAAFFETMSMTEEEMDEEMADEDDWSGSDDSTDSEHVIEESVEYEGGRRLSADGGDDMWMTDEDDYERPISPLTVTEAEKVVALANEVPSSIVNNDLSSGRPQFSQFSNMPSKFAILDEAPPVSLHYISSPVSLNANLMRRIRKEHKILQSSLPEGIWVRTWADRLDLIRVLIIGAETTPYNLAPFVIDFQFPEEFPKVPPNAHFHSWTNGLGRINPNLYEDGKICLSLLGTWSGEGKNEEWSETGSSMLQVIVSLLGLVLVKEPYYSKCQPTGFPFTILHFMVFLHDDLRHLARAAGSTSDDDVNFSATFTYRLISL